MFKLFARTKSDAEEELKQILGGYELPTFPAVYLKALQQVRDDRTAATALADTLATDPGLTMRLLRTVNSAAFGLRSQIKSVHHAVSLLGRAHIESTLLSLASHSALPADPAPGFDPARFWKTAARRAATARALADTSGPSERSECFTAALLQDMALPMLANRFGAPYAQLLERWHTGDGELHLMEREAFGWDHARVAALMCAGWRFPKSIAEAIASHHGCDDPDVHQLRPVTLVAWIRETDEDPADLGMLVEQVHMTIGMEPDRVRALIDESFRNAEEIAQQFR